MVEMTRGTINPGLMWESDDLQQGFLEKQGLMSLQADPHQGMCAFSYVVALFPGPHPSDMLQGALSGLGMPASQDSPGFSMRAIFYNVSDWNQGLGTC